ncbi:MAG TPA: heme o synthase [Bacillota bacterium]|nr:heme o synthase [Bacillota bacterium]
MAEQQFKLSTFLADLKSLTKSFVLIANVLPVFAGFWLAIHFANISFFAHIDTLIITLIGSTLTIAGALILNNWYEVDLDEKMARTKERPTVTGSLSMHTILALGIILSAIGLGIMFLVTFEAAVYAFLGWFTYVVLYTFWSKRKYTLNTMIGSVSGAFTPLIGWAAIDSAYHVVPITLFVFLLIWQIPHTFAITIRRFEEYKAAGVPMLPVVYGFEVTKRQTVIYIACLLPLPIFLLSLGVGFVVIATLANLIWLVVGLRGFFVKDDVKWANTIFYFSLSYLTIFFALLIGFTLPIFN